MMTDLFSRIKKFIIHSKNTSAHIFEELSLELFEYQYKNNRVYRKFCELDKKTPRNVASWKEIPGLPVSVFKRHKVSTFPVKNTTKYFQTSGTTTGESGRHYFKSLELYEASILEPFKKYLLADNAKCQFYFLTASPAEAPRSSLSHMMGVVNRAFSSPKGKYYIKKGRLLTDHLIEDLNRSKNKAMILSTAFSLAGFLDILEARDLRLRLPRGSRLMETGGFKGRMREVSKALLYRRCDRYLGIKPSHCVSEYGMTELSSQYYDTKLHDDILGIKRAGFKASPPWLKTVVMDPATGREARKGTLGLLKHVDLANVGSALSVQTEDLGRTVGGGIELVGRAPKSTLRGCSLMYETLSV